MGVNRKHKLILSSGLLLIILFSWTVKTSAFEWKPRIILQRSVNLISTRISDLLYYLLMQKRYIFENFQDPNNYQVLRVPAIVEKVLTSSTSTAESSPVSNAVSHEPISLTTTTVPKLQSTNQVQVPRSAVEAPIIAPVVSSPRLIPVESVQPREIYYNNSLVFTLTNKEREGADLSSLSPNKLLDQVANLRADDIFDNQYFEHESLDGRSATDLAVKVGYDYYLIGENLALGNFTNEAEIISAWMDSPGHRHNILNAKYQELGVSIKRGIFDGEAVTIAVQIFAVPASACNKPSPEIKELIDKSSLSIKQMQAEASQMLVTLEKIKNDPALDRSYYYQKIAEYNYFAQKTNEAVSVLKGLIDNYNQGVTNYNSCLGN